MGFEGTTIDPIGAIIAVVVFQAITASRAHHEVAGVLGSPGGSVWRRPAVGVAVLWLLLRKVKLTGISPPQAVSPR